MFEKLTGEKDGTIKRCHIKYSNYNDIWTQANGDFEQIGAQMPVLE
jgi:hypothetical protein